MATPQTKRPLSQNPSTPSARVAPGGLKTKDADLRSSALPKAFLPQRSVPSSMWDNAKLDDIGSGFEIIETTPVLEEITFNNPFILGKSRFIFFESTPVYKVKTKKRVIAPLNLTTKLSKPRRARIKEKLHTNMQELEKFFMEDILPVTMSIGSAVANVDEMMTQLLDSKANLPLNFIQQQALKAASFRIIRMMGTKFKLNEKEQKMMFREYTNAFKI
jgi:hypothetical protein